MALNITPSLAEDLQKYDDKVCRACNEGTLTYEEHSYERDGKQSTSYVFSCVFCGASIVTSNASKVFRQNLKPIPIAK